MEPTELPENCTLLGERWQRRPEQLALHGEGTRGWKGGRMGNPPSSLGCDTAAGGTAPAAALGEAVQGEGSW